MRLGLLILTLVTTLGCWSYKGAAIRIGDLNGDRSASPQSVHPEAIEEFRSKFESIAQEIPCRFWPQIPGDTDSDDSVLYECIGSEREEVYISLHVPRDGSPPYIIVNDWGQVGGSMELRTMTLLFREIASQIFPDREVSVTHHDLGARLFAP